MKRMKYRHCFGLTSRMRNALGTAPRKGPKMGMMFVTPTNTEMIGVYGKLKIEQQMKQMMPMMSESSSLPRTKPLKMRSASDTARSVRRYSVSGRMA